ncbi:MAG: hypothetical protein LBT87_01855 [Treponema sp.]|nr:hypothetical protein [Treponema sp.]
MQISVMVRLAATTRGERLPVAVATPAIQIAVLRDRSGSVQDTLPDFLPIYTMRIPKPRAMMLKKYSTIAQDTLRPQTNTGKHPNFA